MKKIFFASLMIVCCLAVTAQHRLYKDSLKKFQQEYMTMHEVVKIADQKYFRFFPINEKYKVTASFKKINDTAGFIMKTSGKLPKKYFRYGTLSFKLNDSLLHLTVYQSEQLMTNDKYKDYLFVPYTDLTSGEESYGGGKYIEFYISDIKNNTVVLDFNKAYNPYCAYTSGYNCPIPPRENDLPVAVKAGEKAFGKSH